MNHKFIYGQVPKVHIPHKISSPIRFTFGKAVSYDLLSLDIYTAMWEVDMSGKNNERQVARQELSGLERLGLRVSAMINSPAAQIRRSALIHRLDSDGDLEWEEVMGLLSETDELEITFNDDGTVTVRWEPALEDERLPGIQDEFEMEEPAPF